MKLVLLAEAQRRFEAEDEWWREHREAEERRTRGEPIAELVSASYHLGGAKLHQPQ